MQLRILRRHLLPLLALAAFAATASAQPLNLNLPDQPEKLDSVLRQRAKLGTGFSRVIIRAADAAPAGAAMALLGQAGGSSRKFLPIISGGSAVIPNAAIQGLSRNPLIGHISIDRVTS